MAKAAAATESRASFEASLSAVTGIFVALGFKSADTWDRVKVTQKLDNLPKLVEKAGNTSEILDDAQSSLLDDLLNALDAGTSITLTESEDEEPTAAEPAAEEAPAPAPTKKGVPAKKAQTVTATKAAPKPPEKKHTSTRLEAAAKTIVRKQSWKLDEVIEAADAEYVKAGGNSNPKESAWAVKVALQVLTAVEMVTVADGKITRN